MDITGELKRYKMHHLWQFCSRSAVVRIVGVMSELTWPRLGFIEVIWPPLWLRVSSSGCAGSSPSLLSSCESVKMRGGRKSKNKQNKQKLFTTLNIEISKTASSLKNESQFPPLSENYSNNLVFNIFQNIALCLFLNT